MYLIIIIKLEIWIISHCLGLGHETMVVRCMSSCGLINEMNMRLLSTYYRWLSRWATEWPLKMVCMGYLAYACILIKYMNRFSVHFQSVVNRQSLWIPRKIHPTLSYEQIISPGALVSANIFPQFHQSANFHSRSIFLTKWNLKNAWVYKYQLCIRAWYYRKCALGGVKN